MSDLAAKTCVPCRGGVPPLKGEELAALETQLDGWNVIEGHHITKAFKFPDFREALKFVNRVGELAEGQGHHPDIFLGWGKVEITTWTHKINGRGPRPLCRAEGWQRVSRRDWTQPDRDGGRTSGLKRDRGHQRA